MPSKNVALPLGPLGPPSSCRCLPSIRVSRMIRYSARLNDSRVARCKNKVYLAFFFFFFHIFHIYHSIWFDLIVRIASNGHLNFYQFRESRSDEITKARYKRTTRAIDFRDRHDLLSPSFFIRRTKGGGIRSAFSDQRSNDYVFRILKAIKSNSKLRLVTATIGSRSRYRDRLR